MNRVIKAELRDSWPSWLGVSLGFVTIGFALTLSALVMQSALAASGAVIPATEASVYAINGGTNLVLATVVGLSVVSSSTLLVVDSRRGAVARLSLVGATPSGVVSSVLSQLTVVALAAALVGDLLAIAALRSTLDFLQAERGAESAEIPTPMVVEPATVVAVNLAWVLVVLIGGWRQARRASRIPPVEALRQAQGLIGGRSRAVGRWVCACLAALIILGMFALVPVLTAVRTRETFSQVMQLNLLGLVVVGWFFAELMPTLVRPLTALWTRWVPRQASPEWGGAGKWACPRPPRAPSHDAPYRHDHLLPPSR